MLIEIKMLMYMWNDDDDGGDMRADGGDDEEDHDDVDVDDEAHARVQMYTRSSLTQSKPCIDQ